MTMCNLSKIQNQGGDTSTCTTVNMQAWALQLLLLQELWVPVHKVPLLWPRHVPDGLLVAALLQGVELKGKQY
jgi:hypothetical protein